MTETTEDGHGVMSDAEFEDKMFKAAAEYRNKMGGRMIKVHVSVEAMQTARAALERQGIPVLASTSLATRRLGCFTHRFDRYEKQCAVIAEARSNMRLEI